MRSLLARSLLTMLCALLAAMVILLGSAEAIARTDQPKSLERAGVLERNWNAARLEQQAERAEASGDSGQARERLRAATQASPRNVSAWTALGFAEERAGNRARAERAFNQAARLDHQFLPAWTLANFYFRHDDREAFWTWSRVAAHRTYDDSRPLFRLCEVFEPDARVVMDRLGGESNMLAAYVTYLAGEARRLDAAEIAARRLIALHPPNERPVISNLITREIAAGRFEPAVALSNAAWAKLDPAHGPVLANGDFSTRPEGESFDWSMPGCDGVISEWQHGRVAFYFSGLEADECTLLVQPIPVAKAHTYRLRVPPSAASDVLWEICGSVCKPADAYRAPETRLARLRLVYRRTPGTLAFAGTVRVSSVQVEVE